MKAITLRIQIVQLSLKFLSKTLRIEPAYINFINNRPTF